MIGTFLFGLTIGVILGGVIGLVYSRTATLTDLISRVDKIKFDMEVLSTERNFYKGELEKQKKWDDFLPTQYPQHQPPELFNANLKKDEKGKFNPDDVPGVFDGVFGEIK